MLSSSCAIALCPFELAFTSCIDVSDGVVALDTAAEPLVDAAIFPEPGGLSLLSTNAHFDIDVCSDNSVNMGTNHGAISV